MLPSLSKILFKKILFACICSIQFFWLLCNYDATETSSIVKPHKQNTVPEQINPGRHFACANTILCGVKLQLSSIDHPLCKKAGTQQVSTKFLMFT